MGEPIVVDGIAEADFGEWDSLNFAEVKERWPDELAADGLDRGGPTGRGVVRRGTASRRCRAR